MCLASRLASGFLGVALLAAQYPALAAPPTCEAGNPLANAPVRQPQSDYTDHGNGTVTHAKTGLMWKRCSEATSEMWTGSMCYGSPETYTWANALSKAKDSSFAGHSDWRVPNKKELESIIETCGWNPAINATRLSASSSLYSYWTATSFAPNVDSAWTVDLSDGGIGAYSKTSTQYVRLVRGGQSLDAFDLLNSDTTPDAFSFTPQTGVPLSSVVTSNTITVAGLGFGQAGISVANGEFSVNGGVYGTATSEVSNGDTVTVRQTSSASYGTLTTASMTLGTYSANFNVTTLAPPDAPTIGAATPGSASAIVSFIPNGNGSAPIDNFRVTCNPGSHSTTGSASPITVPGLTNGVTYTCTAAAHNSVGWSTESAASNSVTPPGVQRAFVAAVTGNDANVTANCSVSAPCRTFATAIGVVVSGGEIIAMQSGEYEPVAVDRSATLLGAPGQVAAITPTSGNAVTVSAPGVKVVLRGLQISGAGGSNGIDMTAGTSLQVENCVIAGFGSGYGIRVQNAAEVNVSDTILRDNWRGIALYSGSLATITRSKVLGSVFTGIGVYGPAVGSTRATITRSMVSGTGTDWGISAQATASGAKVEVEVTGSAISGSDQGVRAAASNGGEAKLILNRSKVSGNAVGLTQNGAGATLYSRGNNTIFGNTTNTSGTITPLAAM